MNSFRGHQPPSSNTTNTATFISKFFAAIFFVAAIGQFPRLLPFHRLTRGLDKGAKHSPSAGVSLRGRVAWLASMP
jgi:hypothetical protein